MFSRSIYWHQAGKLGYSPSFVDIPPHGWGTWQVWTRYLTSEQVSSISDHCWHVAYLSHLPPSEFCFSALTSPPYITVPIDMFVLWSLWKVLCTGNSCSSDKVVQQAKCSVRIFLLYSDVRDVGKFTDDTIFPYRFYANDVLVDQ